jgi:plasmid stability protein
MAVRRNDFHGNAHDPQTGENTMNRLRLHAAPHKRSMEDRDRNNLGAALAADAAMEEDLGAAIARSIGAAVATRNVADFDDCGIEVIDPWNG